MPAMSDRHVARLEKDGLIPPAVRLRASVRWPRRVIEDWIAAGCPANACTQDKHPVESGHGEETS